MKQIATRFLAAALILGPLSLFGTSVATGQTQTLQQKLQHVKQLVAANKQQLARYSWQMQETVSVKGDVKSQTLYRVQLGPSGSPEKTVVSQSPSSGGGRQFGIRHRVEENYKQYAQQVGSLAQSYAQLNPAAIQKLYAQGYVRLRTGGSPGNSTVVLSNYLKPGDSIVLTMRENPRGLVAVNVSSYLNAPSDIVTMQVIYAKLSDGTQYASTVTVNGESKNLTITDQSSHFQLK
jgi:exonuclease VII large subunit